MRGYRRNRLRIFRWRRPKAWFEGAVESAVGPAATESRCRLPKGERPPHQSSSKLGFRGRLLLVLFCAAGSVACIFLYGSLEENPAADQRRELLHQSSWNPAPGQGCLRINASLDASLATQECAGEGSDQVDRSPRATACKGDLTRDVQLALANRMFYHCGAVCLFSIGEAAKARLHSYQWNRVSRCWALDLAEVCHKPPEEIEYARARLRSFCPESAEVLRQLRVQIARGQPTEIAEATRQGKGNPAAMPRQKIDRKTPIGRALAQGGCSEDGHFGPNGMSGWISAVENATVCGEDGAVGGGGDDPGGNFGFGELFPALLQQCRQWCVFDLRDPDLGGWAFNGTCFAPFGPNDACHQWTDLKAKARAARKTAVAQEFAEQEFAEMLNGCMEGLGSERGGMSAWISQMWRAKICGEPPGDSLRKGLPPPSLLRRQCGQWCVFDLPDPDTGGWAFNGSCFTRFGASDQCHEWVSLKARLRGATHAVQ